MQHEYTALSVKRIQEISHEKVLLKSLRLEGESILPSLFTASLAQYDVRLTKTEFTVATRQYVWLPPLKNYSCDSVELKCGCQAQICSKCHRDDAVLDVAGNHGRTCHPGIKSQKATILEKSLDKIFRVAGGPPTRQPSSYNLLNGYFSKDDMSRLFCGNLSVAASAQGFGDQVFGNHF